MRRLPLLNKINDGFIDSFYNNTLKKQNLIKSFLATVVPWLMDATVLFVVLLSIGNEVPITLLLGVISISTILGVASSLPGGLGSVEAISSLLLISLGVVNTEAVAVILVFRALTLWFGSFVGGLSFLYLNSKIDLTLKELSK